MRATHDASEASQNRAARMCIGDAAVVVFLPHTCGIFELSKMLAKCCVFVLFSDGFRSAVAIAPAAA